MTLKTHTLSPSLIQLMDMMLNTKCHMVRARNFKMTDRRWDNLVCWVDHDKLLQYFRVLSIAYFPFYLLNQVEA